MLQQGAEIPSVGVREGMKFLTPHDALLPWVLCRTAVAMKRVLVHAVGVVGVSEEPHGPKCVDCSFST